MDFLSDDEPDDAEIEGFEQFPTLEQAAMMAAGVVIPSSNEESEKNQNLPCKDNIMLPHQLPRPVYTPPSPPAVMEPLYQPIDGKPVGELLKHQTPLYQKESGNYIIIGYSNCQSARYCSHYVVCQAMFLSIKAVLRDAHFGKD